MSDKQSEQLNQLANSAAQSQVDPWGAVSTPAADPWGGAPVDTPSADWLTATPPPAEQFDLLHPFKDAWIPFEHWVETGLNALVTHFRPLFQAISLPVDYVLTLFQSVLQSTPAPLMIVILMLLSWQVAGLKMGLGALVALLTIGVIGAWDPAMVTLSLVLTSVLFCLLIGLPTGIAVARSERLGRFIRPLLDAMQTTPAFVYLVPVVMLFGIGNVPGVVVTIIFALPPVIRLTSLGIRQVPVELVEAATSFGASKRQLLTRVQLPLAMPTIMAGVNQTLMLALAMVVIASMIAVAGLGQMVLRGIGRLDMGLAATGGLGIVVLAIFLDRLTQSMGADLRKNKTVRWYYTGPVGLLMRIIKPNR